MPKNKKRDQIAKELVWTITAALTLAFAVGLATPHRWLLLPAPLAVGYLAFTHGEAAVTLALAGLVAMVCYFNWQLQPMTGVLYALIVFAIAAVVVVPGLVVAVPAGYIRRRMAIRALPRARRAPRKLSRTPRK